MSDFGFSDTENFCVDSNDGMFQDMLQNDFSSSVNDDFEQLSTYEESPFATSFHGRSQLDDLYDPHISKAQDDFVRHFDELNQAETSYEIEHASHEMHRDIESRQYWENAKQSAEIQDQKDQAFKNYINGINDIIEKYKEY